MFTKFPKVVTNSPLVLCIYIYKQRMRVWNISYSLIVVTVLSARMNYEQLEFSIFMNEQHDDVV